MYELKFIKEKKLLFICQNIIEKVNNSLTTIETDLYSNVIDPFSAVFDASLSSISLSEWIDKEKTRQLQKTLQNEIGGFHQSVLGSVNAWRDLGTGEVADLVNNKTKIIAEVKNKFNTTKGNHKSAI